MSRQNRNDVRTGEPFRLFEIMDGNRFHSAVMPSEGNPFEVLEYVRHEERNGRLRMIEVVNGERIEVAQPEYSEPAIEEHEGGYGYDEEYDEAH